MCAKQNSSSIDSLFEDEFTHLQTVQKSSPTAEIKTLSATLDCFPQKMKAEAIHRLHYIKWVEERLAGGWTEKNLKPLLDEAASILGSPVPNWRTLVRWKESYNQHGRQIIALTPKDKAKGNTKNRLHPTDEAYIYDAVKNFLTSEKPSIAKIHALYKSRIEAENLNIVVNKIQALSYRHFSRRLKHLPIYQVIHQRNGAYAADVEFQAMGAHIPPSRIMERVEIDHTPLDLILLDDELRIPLGRPSLTLMVDAYSHCAVGFNLSLNEPGYDSVRCALLNSIARKDYVKDKYPIIENTWNCYGKPETLVVDNGVEFWSVSLEQACLELGINTQYNPVRKPWLKPLIERMFGTINKQLLEDIPGKTFSNILEKAKYNPQKDAVMRFSAFMEIFHHWLIDVYHREADSRHRYIPALAWEQGFQMFPPAVIEGEEDILRLENFLSISFKRTHGRGGIYLNNLNYDSDELASFRMRYPLYSKGKTKVLVKLNPKDVSYLYVFIDEIKEYLRVPCVDPCGYTVGLSLQQHNINKHLVRVSIGEHIDLESLSRARIYIRERIDQSIEEARLHPKRYKLKGMNSIAKYQGIGSQGHATVVSETPIAIKNDDAYLSKSVTLPQEDDWDDLISGLEAF